jgi:hypothetical protein
MENIRGLVDLGGTWRTSGGRSATWTSRRGDVRG